MKIISVKQPWAYLLCAGIKNIENRTWRLPEKMKGQRVLIQASRKWDGRHRDMSPLFTKEQWSALNESAQRIIAGGLLPTSAIIGSVVFTDCVINHPSVWAEKTEVDCTHPLKCRSWHTGSCTNGCIHHCGFEKYIYNWVVSDLILFDKPILNIKGKLNFWEYPNIHSELDEDGVETCCCQLPLKDEEQILYLGDGKCQCNYCGGKWYK